MNHGLSSSPLREPPLGIEATSAETIAVQDSPAPCSPTLAVVHGSDIHVSAMIENSRLRLNHHRRAHRRAGEEPLRRRLAGADATMAAAHAVALAGSVLPRGRMQADGVRPQSAAGQTHHVGHHRGAVAVTHQGGGGVLGADHETARGCGRRRQTRRHQGRVDRGAAGIEGPQPLLRQVDHDRRHHLDGRQQQAHGPAPFSSAPSETRSCIPATRQSGRSLRWWW